MKEFYDPDTDKSFIKFVDANNLYGCAMSQMLPTGGFKLVSLKKGLNTPFPTITDGADRFRTMYECTKDIMNINEKIL